jgi:hypothetical protein
MSEYVEDENTFNGALCVIFLILLIFVGGEFALILPTWVWILFAIFIVSSWWRSTRD